MKKSFLSLALALALSLSLAVPAFATDPPEQAEGPDTYEGDVISVTNVIEQKTVDDSIGSFYVEDALTCVAPVKITLTEEGSSYDNASIKVDRIPAGSELADVGINDLEDYLPDSDTAEVKEPGTYYVWWSWRDGDGGGFSGYLLTVQAGEVDPDPTVPDTTDPTTTTPGFTDVKNGDWFYEAVQWAVEEEITNGTTATTFSPNQNCTVAHILTFLWRASGSPEPTKDNPFTDVKDGDWFADAAVWASEKGMVTGDTFNPNAPCTRSMAVTYMWQAAGSPEAEAASFTDVPASADYAKAVAWAVENGVTDGTSPTTFSPDTVCTRGHIVTFLYRGFGE